MIDLKTVLNRNIFKSQFDEDIMPRAVLKTASYSSMHLCVAVTVAYCLTGNWAMAFSIGLIEPFFQTIAYAFHERVWEKWVPGRSAPVPSTHACSHTLIRIRDHAGQLEERAMPVPA